MSAGCARRVMRKHILRIFLCFESPDFPDIFSCSSSARKKHMAFAAFPTSVLTTFGRGFLYKPEKPGTRLNLYLTCV